MLQVEPAAHVALQPPVGPQVGRHVAPTPHDVMHPPPVQSTVHLEFAAQSIMHPPPWQEIAQLAPAGQVQALP